MKFFGILLLCLLPAFLPARGQQSYQQLWSEVYRQARADKPRSEIALLERISSKAQTEKNYGQLLSADMLRLSLIKSTFGTDSLDEAKKVLERKKTALKASQPALAAIYACALGKADEALADPALLARTHISDFTPLFRPGNDCFDGDLLSCIAWTMGKYKVAHDYYEKTGNRRAALLTTLWMTPSMDRQQHMAWLDSLTSRYGDLPESLYITAAKAMNSSDSAAIALTDSAMARWPGSHYSNELRNIKAKAGRPTASITLNQRNIHSKSRAWLYFDTQNLKSLDVAIYRKDGAKLATKPIWTATKQLSAKQAWKSVADSLRLPSLPYGRYVVKALSKTPTMKPMSIDFVVSDLNVMLSPKSEKELWARVVDTQTGKALPDAKIEVEKEKDGTAEEDDVEVVDDDDDDTDETAVDVSDDEAVVDSTASTTQTFTLTTDSRGEAVIPYSGGNLWLRPTLGADHWQESSSVYLEGGESELIPSYQITCNGFTDRALYRPGDTVRVALVAFIRQPGQQRKPLANMPLLLKFVHDGEEQADSIKVHTDGFGTAYTQFCLGKQWHTGNTYTIQARTLWKETGAHQQLETLLGQSTAQPKDDDLAISNWPSFRIEEYKLGSLQVKLRVKEPHYEPGDTVTVIGRVCTLSGAPVAQAQVRSHLSDYLRPWRYNSQTEADKSDSLLVTDSNGEFTERIAVPSLRPKQQGIYNLDKQYTVTAPDGQQSNANISLRYSNKNYYLRNLDYHPADGYLRDSALTLTCTLTDAQYNKREGLVEWRFDTGLQGTASANQPCRIPLHNLGAGPHKLTLSAKGDTCTLVINVIDPSAHRLSRAARFWAAASAKGFSDNGQPVVIQAGTSEKNLTLYYEMRSGDSTLTRGSILMSDTLLTRTLYYKPSYGGGVVLSLSAFYQGQMEQNDIELPWMERQEPLQTSWQQWEASAEPGQQQQWRLQVKRSNGQPAEAQVMMTLYDGGLDLIDPSDWSTNWDLDDDLPSAYTESLSNDMDYANSSMTLTPIPVVSVRPATFADGLIYLTANPRTVAYRMGGWTTDTKTKGTFGYCAGIVVDETGAPVIGAYIVSTQGNRTVTDVDGAFTVPVKGSTTITASYIGYVPVKKTVKGGQVCVLVLKENEMALSELSEVSVTGYTSNNGHRTAVKFSAPVIKKDAVVKDEVSRMADKNLSYSDDDPGYNSKDRMADKNLSHSDDEHWIPGYNSKDSKQVAHVRRNFHTLALWAPATNTDSSGCATFDFKLPDNVTTWQLRGLVHDRQGNTATLDTTLQTRLKLMVEDNLPRFLRPGDHSLLPLRVSNLGSKKLSGTLSVSILSDSLPLLAEQKKFSLKGTSDKVVQLPLDIPADGHEPLVLTTTATADSHSDGIEKQIPIALNTEQMPIVKVTTRSASEAMKKALTEMDAMRGDDAFTLAAKVYTAFQLNELEADNDTVAADTLTGPDPTVALNSLQKLLKADGTMTWMQGMPSSRTTTITVAEMLAPIAKNNHEVRPLLNKLLTRLGAWLTEDAAKLKNPAHSTALNRNLEEAFHILYTLSISPTRLTSTQRLAGKELLDYAQAHPDELTILGKARLATALFIFEHKKAARDMLESLRQYAVQSPDKGTYFDTRKAYYSWCDYKIPTVTAAIQALQLINPADTTLLLGMKRWLMEEKKTQKWNTPIVTVDAVSAYLTGPMPKTVEWPEVTGWRNMPAEETGDRAEGFTISRSYVPVDSTLHTLRPGDHVRAVIKIHADRDYDYVRITDNRPACLMPVSQLSGYDWRQGCYVRPMDKQTDYYFERLPKGDYTLTTEYSLDRSGLYHMGSAKACCSYNPAFFGMQQPKVTMNVK